jgi:hypothetical protein
VVVLTIQDPPDFGLTGFAQKWWLRRGSTGRPVHPAIWPTAANRTGLALRPVDQWMGGM